MLVEYCAAHSFLAWQILVVQSAISSPCDGIRCLRTALPEPVYDRLVIQGLYMSIWSYKALIWPYGHSKTKPYEHMSGFAKAVWPYVCRSWPETETCARMRERKRRGAFEEPPTRLACRACWAPRRIFFLLRGFCGEYFFSCVDSAANIFAFAWILGKAMEAALWGDARFEGRACRLSADACVSKYEDFSRNRLFSRIW